MEGDNVGMHQRSSTFSESVLIFASTAANYQAAGFRLSYEGLELLSANMFKADKVPAKELESVPEILEVGMLAVLAHILDVIDDEDVPVVFIPFYDRSGKDPWVCKAGGLMVVNIERMDKHGKFPTMTYNPHGPDKEVAEFLVKYGLAKREKDVLAKWGTVNASELEGIEPYIPGVY